MRLVIGSIFSVVAVALVCNSGSFGGDDKKPKYTIKQVMKEAHQKKLMQKVASGEASAEEKKLLVAYYEALCANNPKKGDPDEWKKRTEALLKLAEAALKGEEVGAKLTKAAKCMDCHKVHK